METKLKTVTQIGTVIYTYEYRGYTFYTWNTEPQPIPVITGKGWNLHYKTPIPTHITDHKMSNLHTRKSAVGHAMHVIDLVCKYDDSIRESMEADYATPSK